MTEPHPTYPDLPPIVDERAYQTCVRTIRGLEERADPYDADLLRKLRRAVELYEQSKPPYARPLVIKACECGECTECQLRAELGRRAAFHEGQVRTLEFRLQKGRERIAFLVRAAGLWKSLAKRLRLHVAQVESACDDAATWMAANSILESRLQVAQREARALKLALETTLVNGGAGTSEYARSQPSDACEIELWKGHAEAAWEDLQAWRDAFGPLGPKTPDEVKVYEEVSKRVDRETYAHVLKRAQLSELVNATLAHRLHVKRAEARHWLDRQSVYQRLSNELWRIVRTTERELVKLTVDKTDLQLDAHVLRMQRDNAAAEAEALKVKLAFSQEDVDSANAALTREWSAMTVLRQELQASRAAHEKTLAQHLRALAYLTDKDDVESTPLHAIGHAVQELKGG